MDCGRLALLNWTVWGAASGVSTTFSWRAPPAICVAWPARAGASAQLRHASVSTFITRDPGAMGRRRRARARQSVRKCARCLA